MSEDPEVFLRAAPTKGGQAAAFDSKKWLWVPDDQEGYLSVQVLSTKGDKVTVEKPNGSEGVYDVNVTEQMNPPKFEKVEDMASLTYLNEATVLHNLRQRYYSSLIYTYSGLFCVAINPYRRLPIYTDKVVHMYKGKRRTEMPPHIFAVADNAYRDMLQDRDDQSILITGESGAGKTENTKKVIQYFASIAPAPHQQQKSKQNLEEQVIQANPVLEAFGNAKTTRNDNSSRFGKFIRIHFNNQGKIAGADIEYYLLEKSRVVDQNPGERCFHIFYQLLAGAPKELLDQLLLNRQVKGYHFLKKGEETVEGLDDSEEFKATEDAMNVLGFTDDEQLSIFRIIAGICHFGNIEVKQRPREEWASIPVTTEAEKVAHLLGLNPADLVKALLKPRIKVGNEYVQQGRTESQVVYSIGALSKCLYERLFRWLVQRVNKTLDTKARKLSFIGVLDIAGFEIFKLNTFEQLCINFTNEKLQQFFNHHMFVHEQEEYRKEGIKWEFIDFGLDLAPTIELIEKKMGILSLLDEECYFPKATDKTFVEKLVNAQKGKSEKFSVPKSKAQTDVPHFLVSHYAGQVDYTVSGWLKKNVDPLNESVVELFKKSTETFLSGLWTDYTMEVEKGRARRGAAFITVAQMHKQSLNSLMSMLHNTSPNFIRCIIPNELKKAGAIDAKLVMHQLRCNGVLEGIRICRKGFPNRVVYPEFRQRYAILAPKAIPPGFMDGRKATELLIEAMQMDQKDFRLGHSKVFFKAGVLGHLEEMRDETLAKVLTSFQAQARGYLMRKQYRKMQEQRLAMAVIQRNCRKHVFLRGWQWWRLFTKVKPLLNVAHTEEELKKKEGEMTKLKERIAKEEQARKEMEDKQTEIMQERQKMYDQLQREQEACADAEETVQRLAQKKSELETNIQELVERLDEEMENNSGISAMKRKLEGELEQYKESVEEMQQQLNMLEQEKSQKERDALTMDTELERVSDALARTSKEKTTLEDRLQEMTGALQEAEDKANRLGKTKGKLESSVQDIQEDLAKEKKMRGEVEKVKRKLEGELKTAQDSCDELNHAKGDLEKNVATKAKEIASLQQKIEEDSSEISSLHRKIQELQSRVEELEEELENERKLRQRAEKQKTELTNELEELQERLEEQGGATSVQIELNRKREAELAKLRSDHTTMSEEHDAAMAAMKKKSTEAIHDLESQLESVQKAKSRLEKEKGSLSSDHQDLTDNFQSLQKAKANNDKRLRQLEEQLAEATTKLQDCNATISALETTQSKIQSENNSLGQQLNDTESKASALTKLKQQLEAQLEDTRQDLQTETNAKLDSHSKMKQAEMELQNVQDSLEEEQETKAEIQKQLSATKADAAQWRSKLENDANPRIEELEDAKRKLQNQAKELDGELTGLRSKYSSLEKAKNRLAAELDDVNLELDKERNTSAALDKKQKKIDQQIAEWKTKMDSLQVELDTSESQVRTYGTETLRLKNQLEEMEEQLDSVMKEKKNMQGLISDMESQLSEGGAGAAELAKAKKRLEQELEEVRTNMEDAEGQLEAEEARVLRLQLEMTQHKQENDRKLAEKDEEMESLRKNHQRQLAAMEQSLETEARAKSEATRQKKLAESQLEELSSQLDANAKTAADQVKLIKKLQTQVKETIVQLEEEQRQRDEQHAMVTKAEKRANDMQLELEELRGKMEQVQRQLKTSDSEKSEAQDRVNELTSQKSSLQSSKRKAEQTLSTLQEEYEEMETESRNNAERLRKATEQGARAQSDLTSTRDQLSRAEKAKATLEASVRELQTRLDEEVTSATKSAKKEIMKLQTRIQELESDMESETKGKNDAQRNLRKKDRLFKESQLQLEEEKGNSQRLQDQVNSLTSKMKSVKRDKEDAESEVDSLRSKLRQAKAALDDSEDQVAMLQSQLAKSRGSGSGARAITGRKKPLSPSQAESEEEA